MAANLGQGSLGYTPRTNSVTVPAVANANNGLSLSGSDVVLGQDIGSVGDPGALLNDREIPLNGFLLDLKGNNIDQYINDILGIAGIKDGAGNRLLEIDPINGTWKMGDIDDFTTGCLIQIFNPSFLAAISARDNIANSAGLNVQADPIGAGTVSTLLVADSAGLVHSWFMDALQDAWSFTRNNNSYFVFDFAFNIYKWGDIDAINKGTVLQIDDANGVFNFDTALSNAKIHINGAAGFTGTVSPVNSITVEGGIVTAVS